MASFSTWWPLKNRVSKTRFINQKNLKNFKFQAQPHLIRSDQIRERERVRSDEREGDQIRERERGRARAAQVVRPGSRGQLVRPPSLARPGLHDLGLARLAQPGSRGLGLAWPRPPGSGGLSFVAGSDFFWVFSSSSSSSSFFPSSTDFNFAGAVVLLYIGL